MKKILFSLIGAVCMLASCNDVLDIEDLNSYDPGQVWNDANLANAYMANIYNMFGNWSTTAEQKSEQIMGIHFYPDRITISNGEYKSWDYATIRLINQAIQDINAGSLDQSVKDNITGQALFMRAYAYFQMVMYHGGVPYITVPQDRYEDDLYVPRNSTAECFEFILRDLDEAIAKLPGQIAKTSEDYGKIDAKFALAFKAKVLLYKASPQFNPSNPWDNAYWADAYQVNKQAYEELAASGYALAENYEDIALVERGPEVVFAVVNAYPNKVAVWEHGVRPGSESRGPANACPTWEYVKEFPMKDGKRFDDPSGKYYKSEEQLLQSFWENRDPRFEKSVVWNGKIYEVSGKAGRRQYTALGIAHELDDFGVNPRAGVNSTNLDRYSGFFIQKNSLLRLTQEETQQYDVDFVLMRFAEVMLNYAEAANETGRLEEALGILRQIRARAGIESGEDGNYGITAATRSEMREAILAERNIEFCFEGHRFWDLRRLRMLERLDGTTKHGVEAIAVNEDGTEMSMAEARARASSYELEADDFKYSLLQVPRSGVKVNSVPETYYFFPIQESVIDRNHMLEQNNNWGGSFNPTLE
jgi:SusD family.